MVKTMQERTTQKIGPGSYLKDANLNMIGRQKTSNSVKGLGNGFLSRADRGLETTVIVRANSSNKFIAPPMRSLSVQRPNSVKADNKAPRILP